MMTLDLEYPVRSWRLRGRVYCSEVRESTTAAAIDWLCRERTAHATLQLRLEVDTSSGWVAYYGQEERNVV